MATKPRPSPSPFVSFISDEELAHNYPGLAASNPHELFGDTLTSLRRLLMESAALPKDRRLRVPHERARSIIALDSAHKPTQDIIDFLEQPEPSRRGRRPPSFCRELIQQHRLKWTERYYRRLFGHLSRLERSILADWAKRRGVRRDLTTTSQIAADIARMPYFKTICAERLLTLFSEARRDG